ncbi:MAG: chemotaxis protein CheX [Pseudomonadota bacterium]
MSSGFGQSIWEVYNTLIMRVDFINPFINATRQMMLMMAGIKEFRKAELLAEHELKAAFDVSAVIGLTGAANGTIVLSFTETIASEIMARLVGEPVTVFDRSVCDAVGEMVNIIVGSASAELSRGTNTIIERSIPSVVLGRGHRIHHPANIPCINIFFHTEVGEFAMQVSFKSN